MEKRKRSIKPPKNGTHEIKIRGCIDSVQNVRPESIRSLYFSIACTNCGHVTNNVKIQNEPENFIQICPECKLQNSISIVDLFIEKGVSKSMQWEPLMVVDCKNCRIDVVDCNKWIIKSESGKEYQWEKDENDFFEFDNILMKPISVTNIDFFTVSL